MGTVGSFLRSNDDVQHIPIEMKPRGKLGLGRVGSIVGRKPKGGSLRSALSIELENAETERIKREFEMYRLDKENDIANWLKKEKKLEQENKRMRSELLALQKMCTKLRNERDAAFQAEQRALARAASFECDRDKVQRRFKMYRETAEFELQNVLRDRRNLENKVTKYAAGLMIEDGDSSSRFLPDGGTLGTNNQGDWWSEPSLGSSIQLHQPTYLRGPEFAHTMMELEGPFTNVNKEDWSCALANLNQNKDKQSGVTINRLKRIYLTAPCHMAHEVHIFIKEYIPVLESLCDKEGRCLVLVYVLHNPESLASKQNIERYQKSREKQIETSCALVAFLGQPLHGQCCMDIKAMIKETSIPKPTVFICSNQEEKCFLENEIGVKLKDNNNVTIIPDYHSPQHAAELVYNILDKLLKHDLGIDKDKPDTEQTDINYMCGGVLWDMNYDNEQTEALTFASNSTCQLGFDKYYEKLNNHVSAAGPYPPLLVMGTSGSGRSLLLSKWLEQQREKNPNCLILYHFVDKESSVSADPILMIRRLSSQLMQQINNPPVLSNDSTQLVEDFPRWLEKISSKSPGGTILVLDSIDRFQQAELHLKWLLDPLPVDARVIVSVHEHACPQVWRSWPTLQLELLDTKSVRELLWSELSAHEIILTNENESKILSRCQNLGSCTPLYVIVIAAYIISCNGEDNTSLSSDLNILLSSVTCDELYISIIGLIERDFESPQYEGMIKLILKYMSVSRNGIEENELFGLIPELTWMFFIPVIDVLTTTRIIKYHSGVLTLAHHAAIKGVNEICFGKSGSEEICDIQHELIDYHTQFLSPGMVSCRIADELPWLLRQAEDKSKLQECLLNLCIFQHLYTRGRASELLTYWQYLDIDKNKMASLYFSSAKRTEEVLCKEKGLSTLPLIADLYETLGRFLNDLILLNQALPPLQRALEIRETALDPDHPMVGRALHQLAGLHAQWGKYSIAEALFKQALEIYENAFGFEHELVAKEVESLAILYQKQNKHDVAEPLRKRAFSIKRRIKSIQNNQGNASEKLQRRTLHLEELALGPESPDLARTLNELGVLYHLQNDWETSESFFKRSLEMRESLLGKDHLDLAQSLNNLAALYNDKKMYDKAEPLYERALQIRLKHLSPDSAGVSNIIRHLSMVYRKQNKYHEAEPAYEKALKIYEESLGSHNPRVAETLRNLAVMKYEQKDFETAARLYKRATEIKESEASYSNKVLSRRSSSGDTNSTIKNILHPS